MYDDDSQTPTVDGNGSDSTGSDLLNDVREAIRHFCVLPGEQELVAVVLWCAQTHLVAEFDYAPRLVIRSAEKRSGKSRLLEVIDGLVYKPLRAVNATVAYVFRSLDTEPPPTLLFDEADTIFGSKRVADKNEDLRGLLNAGFQRGLPFGRVVGPDLTTQEFSTFAMAALAGIGRMPETIEDRAVVVVMKRRREEEAVHPYRPRRDGRCCTTSAPAWPRGPKRCESERGEPTPSYLLSDRAADVWEPLVSVAELAGGEWPHLAREAAVAIVTSATEDDTARSPELQLLADIRTVFEGEFMKSLDLCGKLCAISESPWGQYELSPSKLGWRLREYSVTTGHSEDKSERGYHRKDFADAFARYLPPEKPSEGVRPVQRDIDSDTQAGNMIEPRASSRTINDLERQASVGHTSADPVPDTLDTVGRLVEMQGTRPSPAAMPKHLDTGTSAPSALRTRQRSRTRGHHSRPRH
ncbi:DUF3631 domain-containing protein [Mycolicibacterium vaccae]|nr:DUF3631 domain-containing protein [Mycolicibacterium vaccae]